MEITEIRSLNSNKTENGTSIIQPGQETNKDIFLKMLVAQMTNQDPFNPQDPTQYITQLSQFTTLEQMMTLNNSMEYLIGLNNGMLVNSAVETASSLIGKHVELSAKDENGDYEDYSGVVKSVSIKEGTVCLEVQLDSTGEIKEFEYNTLVKINENNKNNESNESNENDKL